MNSFTLLKKNYPSLEGDEIIILDKITNVWTNWEEDSGYPYRIKFAGSDSVIKFKYKEDRDKAFEDLTNYINNQKNTKPMNNTISTITSDVKNFVKEHRQVIYYVAVVLLVDHFFLNGQLTDKVKNIMQTLLNKAEKAIGAETKTVATVETPATKV